MGLIEIVKNQANRKGARFRGRGAAGVRAVRPFQHRARGGQPAVRRDPRCPAPPRGRRPAPVASLPLDQTVQDVAAAFAFLEADDRVDASRISVAGFGWGGSIQSTASP